MSSKISTCICDLDLLFEESSHNPGIAEVTEVRDAVEEYDCNPELDGLEINTIWRVLGPPEVLASKKVFGASPPVR
jgi:hypothetical protein